MKEVAPITQKKDPRQNLQDMLSRIDIALTLPSVVGQQRQALEERRVKIDTLLHPKPLSQMPKNGLVSSARSVSSQPISTLASADLDVRAFSPAIPAVPERAVRRVLEPDQKKLDELVDKAVGGDTEAFGELYKHYFGRIVYYLGRKVDRAVAEDLAQNTFINAWRGIERFSDKEGLFVPWLFRIAHNVLVSYYRRNRTTEPVDLYLDLPDPADPEREALQNVDADHVMEIIGRLKNSLEREVLAHSLLEDLSHMDVAERTGISAENSRVIKHRGLEKIREVMRNERGNDI